MASDAAAVPRTPVAVTWYRSPIDRAEMKALLERSDALAWAQTLAFLGLLVTTATTAVVLLMQQRWALGFGALYVHWMFSHFYINAVHELGHGTVFKTRWLNTFWAGFFSFFGWINHLHFDESHTRHHRYTLHRPDDLEVTLPQAFSWRDFWRYAFIDWRLGHMRWTIHHTINLICSRLDGEWNAIIFPANDPAKRAPIRRWALFVLLGHATIIGVCLALGWWVVPLVTSLSFGGSWLQALANNTQHIGLQDEVPDARLCCRTLTVNPFMRLLYWHMNYHIEHHMFAAVPCYRLGRLHRLIKADLPPCPAGLVACWREINAIQRRAAKEPGYQHVAALPPARSEPAPVRAQPSGELVPA
jgi:fatty acid desaturase